MEKRKITVDNGGSELRYISNTDGKKMYLMDKEMSKLERESFRVKENIEEMDLIVIVSAPKSEYIGLYAVGAAHYMYSGVDVKLDNQSKKADSLPWYIQVITAIASDAIRAARSRVKIELTEGDEEELSYDYTIVTLLPVTEYSGDIDYATRLKINLDGEYIVEFPAIKDGIKSVKFKLSKENIGVVPEGAIVITSLRKEITPNEYSLVIDMGHVSTDISIFRGVNFMGSTALSSQYAGSTLLKLVGTLYRNVGVAASDYGCIETLNTYKIKVGKKEIDVKDGVDGIKKQFVVNYIKNEILNQIELAGISATSIQNVIPIGAVLGTKNPETGRFDILETIVEECGLENAEIKIVNEDLRYVNINRAAEFCDRLNERK